MQWRHLPRHHRRHHHLRLRRLIVAARLTRTSNRRRRRRLPLLPTPGRTRTRKRSTRRSSTAACPSASGPRPLGSTLGPFPLRMTTMRKARAEGERIQGEMKWREGIGQAWGRVEVAVEEGEIGGRLVRPTWQAAMTTTRMQWWMMVNSVGLQERRKAAQRHSAGIPANIALQLLAPAAAGLCRRCRVQESGGRLMSRSRERSSRRSRGGRRGGRCWPDGANRREPT